MHNFKEQLHLKITRQTCCATAQCIYIVAVYILYLYLLVQDLFVHFILLLWYQKVLDSDSDCFIESPGCCCCWSASWRCDWSVGLMSTLLPPVWRSLTLYPHPEAQIHVPDVGTWHVTQQTVWVTQFNLSSRLFLCSLQTNFTESQSDFQEDMSHKKDFYNHTCSAVRREVRN